MPRENDTSLSTSLSVLELYTCGVVETSGEQGGKRGGEEKDVSQCVLHKREGKQKL